MNVKLIKIEVLLNLGNYEHEKIGIEVETNGTKEDIGKATEYAKNYIKYNSSDTFNKKTEATNYIENVLKEKEYGDKAGRQHSVKQLISDTMLFYYRNLLDYVKLQHKLDIFNSPESILLNKLNAAEDSLEFIGSDLPY